ncbi:GNAT family N-acetyltransferase [Actinospica sp.]|jgi:GNAT superfamily N-acetyltransferase|uniref:GNAT family N-acetyltransferase n=1 Tax=Actinospica sp. TaxID=1872142 RepID=UPI002CF7FC73|nr:GNAT family N-acetyltransferase [Actinospica sp.]HWG27258.1 GNAT family N-acetyltransferase [Actinospica sp.]
MRREPAAAWVAGWVVSRGTARPRPTPWGLWVEVGTPKQHGRYVMLEAREPIVRDLATRAQVPALWMKAFAEPEELRPWLTADWTEDDPGWLMAVDLTAERVRAPDGYSVDAVSRDGVVFVTVSAADGAPAARGQVGIAGDAAVVDQVSTEPAYQRRGLGTVVLRALANAALEAGSSTGILGATAQGRALYETLGWKAYAPLTGFIYRGPAAPKP